MNSLKLILLILIGFSSVTLTAQLNSCLNELVVSYENVVSVNNKITSMTNLNRLECISTCAFHQKCMAVFHRETTNDCILYSQHINDLALVSNDGWLGFGLGTLGDPNRTPTGPEIATEFWGNEVTDFSSEYSEDGYRAIEILGEPDVYDDYGDKKGNWASAGYTQGTEWIQVRFVEALYITRVDIYETFNAGGTYSVEVKRPNGTWDNVWTTSLLQQIGYSRINSIDVQIAFVSNEIKVTVDPSEANYWVELDAVRVIGWPQ